MSTYYHVSRRSIRIGATLTQGTYGERIIDERYRDGKYPHYIKEKIFEDVREREYPDKPSRLNCSFLFPTLECARNYWSSILQYQAYIYEVKIEKGIPFVADMDLLHCDGLRFSIIQGNARKYFEGVQHPHSCTLEALVNGKVSVLKEIAKPSKIW